MSKNFHPSNSCHVKYAGHCPIPWARVNSNIIFKYDSSGPQLVYRCLPRLQPQEEIISVCTSNGTWYPNPADIVCTFANEGIALN